MTYENKPALVNITVYNFLSRIVFYLFLFLSWIYASRVFDKEHFGHAQYISWLVNFAWLIFNAGGPATINHYISGYTHSSKLLGRFTIFIVLFSIITAGLAWFVLTGYLEYSYFKIGFVCLLALFVANYLQGFMQMRFLFIELFYVSVIASFAGLVLLWKLLPVYGVEGYIITFTIFHCILVIGYAYYLIKYKRSVEKDIPNDPDVKSLLKTAIYFAISTALSVILWQRTEFWFIRHYLSLEAIGTYSIAFSLITMSTEFLRILPGPLLTYFAALRDDKEEVRRRLFNFMRYFAWIVVFVCLFTAIEAESLTSIIFTKKYLDSVACTRILMIGFIPGVCSYVLMHLHVGLGRSRFLMIQDGISAITFLFLCVTMIPTFALEGAAWAKATTMVLTATLGFIYTSVKLKLTLPYTQIMGSVFIALLIMIPIQTILNDNLFLLVIKAILTFIVYACISLITGIIEILTMKRIAKEVITSLRSPFKL